MVNLERIDVASNRAAVERLAPQIMTIDDRTRAKLMLAGLAKGILGGSSRLLTAANRVVLPGDQRFIPVGGAPQVHAATRAESDASFEAVLRQCREMLDHLEGLQKRMKDSDNRSWDDTRGMALGEIAEMSEENGGNLISSNVVQERVGLSNARIDDAIRHLRDAGAIDCGNPVGSMNSGTYTWHFRITPHGRDMIAGNGTVPGVTFAPQSLTIYNNAPIGTQQIGDGNVANVANTTNIDLSTVTNVLRLVRDHIDEFSGDEREDVENHLALLEEESALPQPRASRLKSTLKAIGHTAGSLASSAAKAAIEAAVSGAINALMGG
jgi:hypothetical protein